MLKWELKKEKLDPSKEWTKNVDACVAHIEIKEDDNEYGEYAKKVWYDYTDLEVSL